MVYVDKGSELIDGSRSCTSSCNLLNEIVRVHFLDGDF